MTNPQWLFKHRCYWCEEKFRWKATLNGHKCPLKPKRKRFPKSDWHKDMEV